jgi:hypothetical protein
MYVTTAAKASRGKASAEARGLHKAQLGQVLLVGLHAEQGLALARQHQQRAPGLHQLARLDRAGQHHRRCRRRDAQLREPHLGLRHARRGLRVGGQRQAVLGAARPRALRLRLGGLVLALRDIERAPRLIELRRRQAALLDQQRLPLVREPRQLEVGVGLAVRLARDRPGDVLELREPRPRLLQPGPGHRHGGARLGVIELHQQVAGLDAIALLHRDLRRHAGQHAADGDARGRQHPPADHDLLHDLAALDRHGHDRGPEGTHGDQAGGDQHRDHEPAGPQGSAARAHLMTLLAENRCRHPSPRNITPSARDPGHMARTRCGVARR